MTPADLQALRSARAQPQALHDAVAHGLLHAGWGRDAVQLGADEQADLAGLLARWIANAPLRQDADLGLLVQARGPLRRLLEAMGLGLGEVVLRALGAEGVDLASLAPATRAKLAALADAHWALQLDLPAWSAQEPTAAMLFAVQALDSRALDGTSQAALCALLDALPRLALAPLPLFVLPALQRAAFLVSYIDSPSRYLAKAQLVAQARHILAGHGLLVDAAPTAAPDARPHLAVVGEGLATGHAMWRFYAEPLRDLRRDFRVTLLGPASHAPDAGDLADACIALQPSDDPVRAWTRQVQNAAPDIVFYPGIGMTFATFTLSLQRLARLQVASTATPAPSGSPTIDATLLFDDFDVPPGLGPVLRYDHHVLRPARAALPQAVAATQGPSRCIGVNAVAMKLNDGFLSAIEAVLQGSQRPCRLRFLPNVAGAELQALQRVLLARFPGAEVLPSMDHLAYLAAVGECDLVLQSFPFGGANTTNDALDLGIPVVALEGHFLSGQTDRLLLAARGLDALLCARDVPAYVALASRLLHDDAFAEQVRAQLRALPDDTRRAKRGGTTAADAIRQLWQSRGAAA